VSAGPSDRVGAGEDVGALATAVRAGRRDPVEVVEAALERIAEVDGEVGAFVEVDAAGARREAERVRRAVRDGEPVGPLAGVPLAVKDLFDVAGSVTRAGSRVPPDAPAHRDATAVARLRRTGAVVVGRTRTHEFAWGLTTQHPVLGGTRNPWDLTRIPGGSSGGSAAAVAAGMTPMALGTDTGCSIRLPAAFCGLVGHKPTFGSVPTDGVLPLAPSLDHVGALARTVPEARLLLEVLADRPPEPPAPTTGLRVGVVGGAGLPEPTGVLGDLLEEAVRRLARSVGRVAEVELRGAERLTDVYRVEQGREALPWHRETGRWPRHAELYGDDVRSRLAACEQLTPADLEESARLRANLRGEVATLFDRVDVLLMPVAACSPSRVDDPDRVVVDGSGDADDERQHGDLRAAVLPWTVPANLGGWPACSVPIGRDADGLPVAVQVVGPAGSDGRVLDIAAEMAVELPVPLRS
jgi:aspartyl-tRNA(Asn)/glutamyl-tRNA(Gln) amidotransferase subunit A